MPELPRPIDVIRPLESYIQDGTSLHLEVFAEFSQHGPDILKIICARGLEISSLEAEERYLKLCRHATRHTQTDDYSGYKPELDPLTGHPSVAKPQRLKRGS